MDDKIISVLRAKFQTHRFAAVFDFFRKDIERMRAEGYDYDLIILFFEDRLNTKLDDRHAFVDNLAKRMRTWRKKEEGSVFPVSLTGKEGSRNGVPEFLRYDRSMEPPEEDIFESVRKEIELREREKKEIKKRDT